jgi:homoserine O-acetyltransferase/O-succinyltransferase
MLDYEIFDLGDAVLQRGATIRNAKLAYKTFGTLSPNKDNAIVYPTWYSAQHDANEWLIGESMALDPRKYFIIIPNMLGNGLSSSPSNTPEPYDPRSVPPGDDLRSSAPAAQAHHREIRHHQAQAGDRLVDGRSPNLPMGSVVPGHG